jgi:hypothetical protein
MQSNRELTIVKRKPRIVIDKTFPVFQELNIGDKGQALIYGYIDAERIDEQGEAEWLIKTVKIDKAELINNKQFRV